MTETGIINILTSEIRSLVSTDDIFNYNTDQGALFTPGSREIQITATANAGLVTVVSMIAPSPDWFIVAHNVELYKDGERQERLTIPAVLYDAGTDSGLAFTAENKDTKPWHPIEKLKDAPIVTFSQGRLR